jgi:iron(III) transport system substrate-binding protein
MYAKLATRRWRFCFSVIALGSLAIWGCAEKVPPKVIVFTSFEREVTLAIFAEFTRATGIKVKAANSSGPAQSMNLAREIVAHGAQTRCDLFWDDGIFATLWLDREGMLRSFDAAATTTQGGAYPSLRNWCEVATDARVLVINTRQIAEARLPKSINDLIDPQWYERTGIAKPIYGKSATHAACIFQAWGDAKAREFFLAVKRNARILATDREVAHAVGTGSLAFGLTNSSDAAIELAAGAPIAIVYPDQAEGELGTLFIPSTIALLKSSTHAEPAEQLIKFALSNDVAKRLAHPPGALVPLQAGVPNPPGLKSPAEMRTMSVDFSTAAASWDTVAQFLEAEFAAGD